MTTLEARGRSATVAELQQFTYRVCLPARASSRLMFALIVALAAPAWRMLARRPVCFHLYGCPSGRDDLAVLGASLYGRLELTHWDAVARDPRRVAVAANDGLLVLVQDDTPHRMGMLNAIGALWSEHRGTAQRQQPIPSRTDALTLSVGDILIDQALVFVAAPALRGGLWLVDIPSDAGRGHGIYEEPRPDGYSALVANALMQLQGAVGLHWLEMLSGGWDKAAPSLNAGHGGAPGAEPSGAVDAFTQLPADELARAFWTIALVGELATVSGLTGWERGEACRAVAACEQAWKAGNAARMDLAAGRCPEALRPRRSTVFLNLSHGTTRPDGHRGVPRAPSGGPIQNPRGAH